jgi:hypothetical protein
LRAPCPINVISTGPLLSAEARRNPASEIELILNRVAENIRQGGTVGQAIATGGKAG